jgi:kumamolisin
MAYLQGSQLSLPDDATSISPVNTTEQISINLIVRRPNRNGLTLKEHADGVLNGTSPILTRDEFNDAFGATDQDVYLISSFARQYGIIVTNSHSPSATVTLLGHVGSFNSAFNITIQSVTIPDQTFLSYDGIISIPDNLVGVIEYVMGFGRTPTPKHNLVVADPAASPSLSATTLTPSKVAKAYNAPKGSGAGTCIAILEFGGGYTNVNLNYSFDAIGIITPIIIPVGPNLPDNSNSSIETMLDIFIIGAIAPDAIIVVYFINDWYTGLNSIIHDTTYNPSVISVSWASSEYENVPSTFLAWDSALQSAAILGITVCVASGDFGAQALSPDPAYTVNWPASSNYVLGVGGTELELNTNGTIGSEVAWSQGTSGSGGGVSSIFSLSSWQSGLSVTTYPTIVRTALTKRGIPDVSANASPSTGYNFYYGSSNLYIGGVGGTSAAAPLWAGIIAVLNGLLGKRIGFINPLLYSNPGVLNDISVGNNSTGKGGYLTTIGWDPVTGLGSPNFTALYNLFLAPTVSNVTSTVSYNSVNNVIAITGTESPTNIAIVGGPSYGTATTSSFNILYTPNTTYVGSDLINYQAFNKNGPSNTGSIFITVSPPPAPVSSGTSIIVLFDSINNKIPLNISGTYTNVSVTSIASHGVATSNGSSIFYTPNTGYSGSDSFQYNAINPSGSSNNSVVNVTVLPQGPIVGNFYQSVNFDSNTIDNPLALNFISGTPTEILIDTTTTNGSLVKQGISIFYAPNLGYVGNDQFSYIAANAYGVSDIGFGYITVLPPFAPIVTSSTQAFLYNSIGNVITPVIESYPLAISITQQPTYGHATTSGFNIIYSPTSGFYGTDSINYVAYNQGGTSSVGVITININTPTVLSYPLHPSLPSGVINRTYNPIALTAVGGTAPYNSVVTQGNLPYGLTLNSTTNILNGTPTSVGNYNFVVSVTDSSITTPITVASNYFLDIYPSTNTSGFQWFTTPNQIFNLPASNPIIFNFLTNDPFTTFNIISGSLPNGVSLSSNGVLSGTVSTLIKTTSYVFVVRATSPTFSKVLDAEFTIIVDSVDGPVWSYTTLSNSVVVLPGPSIDNLFLDREYVYVQLTANPPTISPRPYNITYSVASGFDSLPLGLFLTPTGILSGILHESVPLDVISTVTFIVNASDGYISNSQTFAMSILNPDSLRADSTAIGFYYNSSTIYVGTVTSIITTSTTTIAIFTLTNTKLHDDWASLTTVEPPLFLSTSSLGIYRAGEKQYIPVNAYNVTPSSGPITYSINATNSYIPNGLTLDSVTGLLYGTISTQTEYLKKYYVDVVANKNNTPDGSVVTATNTFTFYVIQSNPDIISWISSSSLGTITAGVESMLNISATHTEATSTLEYSLVSGSLPTGLLLDSGGDITGITTASGTYTFSVVAATGVVYSTSAWASTVNSGIFPIAVGNQTFNLTVLPTVLQYTNIYVKPLLPIIQRKLYHNFISNTGIFTTDLIYRPNDNNFGVQPDIKMYIEYGVQQLNSLTNYISSLENKFYKKTFYFGNIKSYSATDVNGAGIYDVVYVEMVDPLTSSPIITSTSTLNINANFFPIWLQNLKTLGKPLVNAVILCYALPGQGYKILDNIKLQAQLYDGFVFNQINFTVDRIVIEQTQSSTASSYLLFPNTGN